MRKIQNTFELTFKMFKISRQCRVVENVLKNVKTRKKKLKFIFKNNPSR